MVFSSAVLKAESLINGFQSPLLGFCNSHEGLPRQARAVVYHDLALETSAPCPRTRVVRLTPAPRPAGAGLGHFQKRRPWYC